MILSAFDLHPPHHIPDTAQHLEACGYYRYWLTEHHLADHDPNPLVAAGAVIGRTTSLRIGTAGILLRLHSPYAVAEQFRLLDALSAGRFDLGVATGVVPQPFLGELLDGRSVVPRDSFGNLVTRLVDHLERCHSRGGPHARGCEPADGAKRRLWVCGMSDDVADLAASHAAGFVFHHSLNGRGRPAVDGAAVASRYRRQFPPSVSCGPSTCIVCFGSCADTRESARALWARGAGLDGGAPAFVGTAADCVSQLQQLADAYGADEVAVECFAPRHEERLRAFELLGIAHGAQRSGSPLVPSAAAT